MAPFFKKPERFIKLNRSVICSAYKEFDFLNVLMSFGPVDEMLQKHTSQTFALIAVVNHDG